METNNAKMITSMQMLLLELKSAKSVCENEDRLFVYSNVIERIESRFIEIEKALIRNAHKCATEESGFESSAEDWANQFMQSKFKDKI